MLIKEDFEMRKLRIQEEQVLNLFTCGGFTFTAKWLPYKDGQIGNYDVQSMSICSDGEAYALAIQHMIELITYEIGLDAFDVVSGGESGDWDFSNPIAVALKKPHAKIYQDGKIFGATMKDKRVLHIADLNDEGSSPRDLWIPAIKKAEGVIEHIAFYVDRMEDGVGEMKKLGLRSHALITLDQSTWEILYRHQKISDEVHDSLMFRCHNKTAWAHNALLTYPEILQGISHTQAQQILDQGYPELKTSLLYKLFGENQKKKKTVIKIINH